MAIPHHTSLGDAEGSAVVRLGSVEIFAGAKFLHFKTSSQQDTLSARHDLGAGRRRAVGVPVT